eukprot:CAMPEP_0185724372 /NCGR_PEP_ID=MMETSP1171-20130828/871_1 /TAXON_ID=374046 /ORGANISM="Helicotheca tamensis, Strain CCMP826" /LENGTH=336 /DNA_ID=CAMNT_0028392207 /DNA_START=253 /DNA_END=1263 /DNA_ORIENTATION=-
MAVWGKYTFVPETETPSIDVPLHTYHTPLFLTVLYLVSLPLLNKFTEKFLSKYFDVKALLFESMVLYNVAQVILNGWMVYRFLDSLVNHNHPFVGDIATTNTGTCYAVWVHYCDKYLEFFDTYFMVLRGKLDQVSFLHVYHHTTIAWAWWAGFKYYPGGDAYFGALLNSWIHVMMYSYYALSLLKIKCPWKRYLTQAQLLQFASVIVYSYFSMTGWPVEQRTRYHYLAIFIQIWEMASLFALFSIFYRKSYGKKKSGNKQDKTTDRPPTVSLSATDGGDDQCQQAVAAFAKTTSEIMDAAAKDATKMVNGAKKTLSVKTNPVQKEVGGVVSRSLRT